ncbi:MAG TPA: hypothetical protein VGM57_14625 [Pseudolabrys sp.]|jgi:hypothetical protein
MTPLSLNYWTEVQPGQMTGLFVGGFLAWGISVYFFAVRKKSPLLAYTAVFAGVGAIVGMVIGGVLVFYF